MKRSMLFGCFAAASLLSSPAFGEPAGGEKILSGPAATSELALRGLQVGGDGSVTGTIVNGTGRVIRNVELLVTHTWAWRNEMHPGEDNPGRATPFRVTGEIPAKGSLPFSYTPDPPLLKRTDGTFQTTVAVQGFTEVGD